MTLSSSLVLQSCVCASECVESTECTSLTYSVCLSRGFVFDLVFLSPCFLGTRKEGGAHARGEKGTDAIWESLLQAFKCPFPSPSTTSVISIWSITAELHMFLQHDQILLN